MQLTCLPHVTIHIQEHTLTLVAHKLCILIEPNFPGVQTFSHSLPNDIHVIQGYDKNKLWNVDCWNPHNKLTLYKGN